MPSHLKLVFHLAKVQCLYGLGAATELQALNPPSSDYTPLVDCTLQDEITPPCIFK